MSGQNYGFSNSHVWMWELDYKESWALKNWCFWTVVLGKTLESPLDCKEIQPVSPKWNQSWLFIEKTDAEAETPILWTPDVKKWLTGRDPDSGKDWRCEEKGMTEDEMVRWYHRLNGHEFEEAPGVVDRQGGLACCSPWDLKESDVTELLNWIWGIVGYNPAFNLTPDLLCSEHFGPAQIFLYVLFLFFPIGWQNIPKNSLTHFSTGKLNSNCLLQ